MTLALLRVTNMATREACDCCRCRLARSGSPHSASTAPVARCSDRYALRLLRRHYIARRAVRVRRPPPVGVAHDELPPT